MSEQPTDPGKKKVLVIDDDSSIRALVMLMMRQCAVKVFDARNGQEGIRVAELIHPQLVLLDLNMPILNGLAVVKHLRSHPSEVLRTVPIVLFTASPEKQQEEALAAGATAVLGKPCPKSLLLQFVEMYLGPVCGGRF